MTSPARVLYVHHTDKLGGATWCLYHLIRQLDRAAFTPVIALPQMGEAGPLFTALGVEVQTCPLPRFQHTTGGWWPLHRPWSAAALLRWWMQMGESRRRLATLIADIQPDLVHFNSVTLAPYSPAIPREIPVVVHVRESVVHGLLGVRQAWLRRLLTHYADRIIYICQDNRDRLTGPHPNGRVIYDPVDFARFDFQINGAAARRELGIPAAAKVVLFVGSLMHIKGAIPFLKAMALVLESVPDLYCLMPFTARTFSDVPWRRLVRGMANVLGLYSAGQQVERLLNGSPLGARTLRTDFRMDIERFYAAADVVAVPFVEPHFALPVLEAGAMGKPVAASRIGGIEEMVLEGQTGLLVPPGDEAALAAATVQLLRDPLLAARMGEAAYRKVVSSCSAEIHARRVAAVYRELLDGRGSF